MAKKRDDSEALTTQPGGYLELASTASVAEVMRSIQESLGAEKLSKFDFPRVTAPQGKSKYLMLPTLDDPDGEPVESIVGIVVGTSMSRSFWKDQGNVNNSSPDCVSDDYVRGVGDPGGICEDCPYSQFGSGKGGRGQACGSKRSLYLLRPGMALPLIIQAAPTSLKAWRQYSLRLSLNLLRPWSVETIVTPKPAVNSSGIDYTQLEFRVSRQLTGQERSWAEDYAKGFQEQIGISATMPEVPGTEMESEA